MSRVHVFIAGSNDELDWLEGHGEVEDTFGPFLADVGCVVMGRQTYDIVSGFEGPWPHGDVPMLGAGKPLFAGVTDCRRFELVRVRELGGGLVELRYRVAP